MIKRINNLKRIIKEEYMLYIFNKGGGIDKLQHQSEWFETTFLSIQMRVIILFTSIIISFISYHYLRVKGFGFIVAFLTTLFILWIIRRTLLTIAKTLIKWRASE